MTTSQRGSRAPKRLVLLGATGSIGLQSGTIYDGGLFLTNAAPAFVVGQNANTGSVTVATIALTMGSRADVVTIQPAP